MQYKRLALFSRPLRVRFFMTTCLGGLLDLGIQLIIPPPYHPCCQLLALQASMPSKPKPAVFSSEQSVDASVSFSFRKFLFCLWPGKQVSGSSIVGTFRSEHFLSCSLQLLTVFTQGILKASCMALEALKATPPTAQSEPVALRSVAWAGHTHCIRNLTVRNWAASWKISFHSLKEKKDRKNKPSHVVQHFYQLPAYSFPAGF